MKKYPFIIPVFMFSCAVGFAQSNDTPTDALKSNAASPDKAVKIETPVSALSEKRTAVSNTEISETKPKELRSEAIESTATPVRKNGDE